MDALALVDETLDGTGTLSGETRPHGFNLRGRAVRRGRGGVRVGIRLLDGDDARDSRRLASNDSQPKQRVGSLLVHEPRDDLARHHPGLLVLVLVGIEIVDVGVWFDGDGRDVLGSRNGHDQLFQTKRIVPGIRGDLTGLDHVVARGCSRRVGLSERYRRARPVLELDGRDGVDLTGPELGYLRLPSPLDAPRLSHRDAKDSTQNTGRAPCGTRVGRRPRRHVGPPGRARQRRRVETQPSGHGRRARGGQTRRNLRNQPGNLSRVAGQARGFDVDDTRPVHRHRRGPRPRASVGPEPQRSRTHRVAPQRDGLVPARQQPSRVRRLGLPEPDGVGRTERVAADDKPGPYADRSTHGTGVRERVTKGHEVFVTRRRG